MPRLQAVRVAAAGSWKRGMCRCVEGRRLQLRSGAPRRRRRYGAAELWRRRLCVVQVAAERPYLGACWTCCGTCARSCPASREPDPFAHEHGVTETR